MRIFEIDNFNSVDQIKNSTRIAAKGKKAVLIPEETIIINTGGYIPHLKCSRGFLKYCHKCKMWLSL